MASIINIGATCWDVASVEQTGLLIDARDYYRAFYQAARAAKRYVLIAGWQFDSDVRLLRGEDAADAEVALLSFLNGLCENNQDLQIYILASGILIPSMESIGNGFKNGTSTGPPTTGSSSA